MAPCYSALPALRLLCSCLCVAVQQFSPTAHPAMPASLSLLPANESLVAFWDFQEAAGQPRSSQPGPNRRGGRSLLLHEAVYFEPRAGPPTINASGSAIERVAGGVWGPYSARIKAGQVLVAPRHESPELSADISGEGAQVSVVAWAMKETGHSMPGIKQVSMGFVAGVWAEGINARQYSVWLNLWKGDLSHLIDCEVSAVGGPTPGHKWCITRAIGTHDVPQDVWNCIALTYDGKQIAAYNNGILERRGNGTGGDNFYSNPFNYTKGIYRPPPGHLGGNFTVGSNVCDSPGYFEGRIGGLAVWDRALSAAEVQRACAAATPATSGN
eukprot:COSAG02_NODE_4095_length_5788_cov_3.722271_1_plen_327_part_00